MDLYGDRRRLGVQNKRWNIRVTLESIMKMGDLVRLEFQAVSKKSNIAILSLLNEMVSRKKSKSPARLQTLSPN
jgi:hypothetical protein